MKRSFIFLSVFLLSSYILEAQDLLRSKENAHGDAILSCALNSDGSLLLTGGADNRAYLWSTKDGMKLKILSHSNRVTSVAISADNKYFVTGCADKKVILFDTKTAKPLKLLRDNTAEVMTVAINPISGFIASGAKNGEIKLWNSKGTLIISKKAHDSGINSIAFNSEGNLLATGSSDNTIKIWDASNCVNKKTIQSGGKSINCVCFSPDGMYLASGDENGVITLWDPISGTKNNEFNDIKSGVNTLVFSPDVQYLLAGTKNGELKVLNMDSHQIVKTLEIHNKGVESMAFSDKGNLFVTAGADGSYKIWDTGEMNIGKKKFAKEEGSPKLVCSPITLTDDNNNGIIEHNDNTLLSFTIENQGKGKAYDVVAKLATDPKIEGLNFDSEYYIGNLDIGKTQKIQMPVYPQDNLKTSAGVFIVSVDEANKNNPSPFKMNFQTKGTENYSYILITGHEYTSATGKAEIGAPITLKLRLKNTSKGEAKNIKVNYVFPKNVLAVDKLSELIDILKPGEAKELEVEFYANKDFSDKELKVAVQLDGATFSNAEDLDLSIKMNEELPTSNLAMAEEVESNNEQPQYRGGGDPLKGLNISKAKTMTIGSYYALIIGIDAYKGTWPTLKNAVNDAKAVEGMLKGKYVFNGIKTLYNDQATRSNIIAAMESMVAKVKPSDNVFIYYSGHGEYKKSLNKGYWVPIDASTNSTSGYISNSDIQTFLGGIKSKHTLLISDACFSGDIFRGNTVSVPFENSEKYYTEVQSLISRQAITSGGLEPVMDGGRDGHSVFAYYLLKTLSNNQNKYLDAGQLYNKIKIPVINNSEQSPKLSPIKNTGDEGGQFIFIKK